MPKDNEQKPLTKQKAHVALQEALQQNMRRANGRFHAKELNERGFINKLLKDYQLVPINKENE